MRSSGTVVGGAVLIGEVLKQVRRRRRVEAVIALEPGLRLLRGVWWRSSRTSLPIANPSSIGRPPASPFQNGIFPGWPGAGDTSTRSCVICSMRHVEAPRRNVSPARASNTISSSSSPTRARSRSAPARKTPYKPRSGIVPALAIATCLAPCRARQESVDAVPGDARPQLGELVRRVAPRQHVEHALEDAAAEFGVRRRPSHDVVQIVDAPVLHRRHRDDLLREHVERIAADNATARPGRASSPASPRRMPRDRRGISER